jgi:hypothetical protein
MPPLERFAAFKGWFLFKETEMKKLPKKTSKKAASIPPKKTSLSEKLKSSGLKGKLLRRLPCPLKLRPELLLHPNLPKPLHGVNPRTINGQNWWDRTRRAVYKTTEFCCLACGVHKSEAKSRQWMEAHEVYDINYEKGQAKFIEVVPLCHFCHNFIHSGRMQALLDKGMLHHSKYIIIIQHGDRILRAAGLEKKSHLERELEFIDRERQGKVAEWSRWRLRIGRKLYPPIFKSMKEWEEHYMIKGETEDDD